MTFEETLQKDGKLIYTNVGVSMMPWIREGKDLMVIESLKEKPKMYDSVLFRRNGIEGRGKYVMHRVMKILPNDEYYIIGDNTISGEIVKLENIIGLLTSIRRKEGNIIYTNDPKYLKKVKLWYIFVLPILTIYRRFKILVKKIIRYDDWRHKIGR